MLPINTLRLFPQDPGFLTSLDFSDEYFIKWISEGNFFGFFTFFFAKGIYHWNLIMVLPHEILSAFQKINNDDDRVCSYPKSFLLFAVHLVILSLESYLHRLSSLNKKIYFLVYEMERKLMLWIKRKYYEGEFAEQQLTDWGLWEGITFTKHMVRLMSFALTKSLLITTNFCHKIIRHPGQDVTFIKMCLNFSVVLKSNFASFSISMNTNFLLSFRSRRKRMSSNTNKRAVAEKTILET